MKTFFVIGVYKKRRHRLSKGRCLPEGRKCAVALNFLLA